MNLTGSAPRTNRVAQLNAFGPGNVAIVERPLLDIKPGEVRIRSCMTTCVEARSARCRSVAPSAHGCSRPPATGIEAAAARSFPKKKGWLGRALIVLACFAATQLVLADPAPDGSHACEAANPRDAKSLADVLYEKREYQRAGECYEAAGDSSRAQLAFVKAAGPSGEKAAQVFRGQGEAARALATRVQRAFRSDH